MSKSSLTFILLCILTLTSCEWDQMQYTDLDVNLEEAITATAANGSLDYYNLPFEDDFQNIPQHSTNPLTASKVDLGKKLFFEPGLGQDAIKPESVGTFSCASCHIPSAGFRPGRSQGIADGGIGFGINGEGRVRNTDYLESEMDVQGIRPLSVLNSAFVTNALWNGQFGPEGVNVGTEDQWANDTATMANFLGYGGLETQNIEALKVHRMVVNKDLMDQLGYTTLFDEAFPEFDVTDRYSLTTASFAIAAYFRTLFANEAPFQKWLKGDKNAMSDQEKAGALVFFTKANCTTCHNGPSFSANEFYALGVNDLNMIASFNEDPNEKKNLGRAGFTNKDEDLYKFKVPQLYNLKDTPFYFHGSSKRTLPDVVEYFNLATPENALIPTDKIAQKFQPLFLTEKEKEDLVLFLEESLRDPNLDRFRPDNLPSGNCFPNNDELSRIDLGCN